MSKKITKSQMKKLALAAEAFYILSGSETDGVTCNFSEEDTIRFQEAQQDIALQWLRQAGIIGRPGSLKEIFLIILGSDYSYKESTW